VTHSDSTLAPETIRVALDGRMAFHSGIGRYVRNLTRELLRLPAGPALTVLAPGQDPRFREAFRGTTQIPYSPGVYTPGEQIRGSWAFRGLGARVHHFPHYNTPWWLPPGSVVTIHDLTHLDFPQFFSPAKVRLARMALGRAVRRAERVIAVSQATCDALERAFPGAAARTEVVHHGVDSIFNPAQSASSMLRQGDGPDRFFLYVGNDKPHKNLDLLRQAFERFQAAHANRPGQSAVEMVFVCDASPGKYGSIRIVPPQPDEQLAALYRAAKAVMLPSLNEGFGMTALEAAACGTPVIASDIPSTREILGQAAILLDPHDEAAWAAAMARVLDDPDQAARHRQLGLERAAEFTWEATARKTMSIYRAVAGELAAG
jgi:glycosyltransferase involved in cell wall biosynthesis